MQSPSRFERELTPAPWLPIPTPDPDRVEEHDTGSAVFSEEQADETLAIHTRSQREQARKEHLADAWAPRLRAEPWNENLEWWLRLSIKAGLLNHLIAQKGRIEERKRKREGTGDDCDQRGEERDRDEKRDKDESAERDKKEYNPSKKRN